MFRFQIFLFLSALLTTQAVADENILSENDLTPKSYCEPSDKSCWPTITELQKLRFNLNPTLNRSIYWEGGKKPLPGPQISSYADPTLNNEQPLFGIGKKLEPLYVRSDVNDVCFLNDFTSEFCKVSVVNAVVTPEYPAFTVFATSATDVKIAVKFANEHKLRVCVAGTGADVMTRHSCNNGLLIRTTLLKAVMWNDDSSTVTFGSGLTFEEAQYQASLKKRFISSGWCGIVGIAGWYSNAGHGPFNPQYGNGADNLVAANMVLSDGRIVTVDKNHYTDLYWAIRGGGGSAFGVLISLTIKTFRVPKGGFTLFYSNYASSDNISNTFEGYASWALKLPKQWGGYTDYAPNTNGDISMISTFLYHGGLTDKIYLDTKNALLKVFPNAYVTELNFPDAYQPLAFYAENIFKGAVSIDPYNYANISSLDNVDKGGPSFIATRSFVQSGGFVKFLMQLYDICTTTSTCPTFSMSQDMTGNVKSPQPTGTSVSPGMRSGLMHMKVQ